MVKIICCVDCGKKLGKMAYYKKTKRCRSCWKKYTTKYGIGYWKGKKMPKTLCDRLSQSHKGQYGYWKNKKRPGMSGKNHPRWTGGKRRLKTGYIDILQPNHPFCNTENRIYEHRFVMEKYLGRYLQPQEVVHHINNSPSDNRIENLIAFANNVIHKRFHKNPKLIKQSEIIFDGRKH